GRGEGGGGGGGETEPGRPIAGGATQPSRVVGRRPGIFGGRVGRPGTAATGDCRARGRRGRADDREGDSPYVPALAPPRRGYHGRRGLNRPFRDGHHSGLMMAE